MTKLRTVPQIRRRELRAARRYLTVRTESRALDAAARQITGLVLMDSGTDLSADPVTCRTCGTWRQPGCRETTVIATRDERFITWSQCGLT